MLKQRIITAVLLAPLVMGCIYFASPFVFLLVLAGVYALCAWEWAGLTQTQWRLPTKIALMMGLIASLAVLWTADTGLNVASSGLNFFIGIALPWWLCALWGVFSYPNSASFWQKPWVKLSAGFATLLPFFYAFYSLRFADFLPVEIDGRWVLFFVMGLVWCADSGAYFAGRLLGKNKLAPAVSPGKTWEGVIGGITCAMLLAFGFTAFMQFDTALTRVWLLSSFIAVGASVLGDLTESLFKREAGVKDSGKLLPGHGGILDRVDSLTAAIPLFLLCVLFLV